MDIDSYLELQWKKFVEENKEEIEENMTNEGESILKSAWTAGALAMGVWAIIKRS